MLNLDVLRHFPYNFGVESEPTPLYMETHQYAPQSERTSVSVHRMGLKVLSPLRKTGLKIKMLNMTKRTQFPVVGQFERKRRIIKRYCEKPDFPIYYGGLNNMLKDEFEFYLKNQKVLAKKYNGKFLVIKGQKVIGVYESELEAIDETSKKEKLGTFLVQKCGYGDEGVTQTFHSRMHFSQS